MTEMELCKRKLERAVEIHRLESRPGPSGFVCALGLMIPSHLWASDADDMIAADNRDCDDARTVMDNWFGGLSRREKLVVFFRAGGMGFKTLMHVLDTEFKIDATSRTTLSADYQRGMLKVLMNAKDHGLWTVFPNL